MSFFWYMILLFFKKLINFNWRLITLQYCGGFCHIFTWISRRYTCVSPSWAPLPPPSPPHPSGLSQRTGFECLLHALNLHWSSILHKVIYMFQCYSLTSSHSRLLPHSPKVCIYISVSCCLAYKIIVTIFLNSAYMR